MATKELQAELIESKSVDASVVDAKNKNGSTLTTTLTNNGQGGIDVNAQGQNIALGGYLVNSQSQLQ